MLEFFRNAAKGWIAKILLSLLVIAFSFWGISGRVGDFIGYILGTNAVDLATIGGDTLSSETYRTEFKRTVDDYSRRQKAPLSMEDARKLGLDQQVLDRLLAQTAVDAKTDKLQLAFGDRSIQSIAMSNPNFQDFTGKFSVDIMRQVLQQNNMTEQTYIASLKREQLRQSMISAAADNIVLPKTITEALLRYKNESRDARYVTFSVQASDIPQPTDDELKKQYEQAPAAYTAPEYRSVAILSVMPDDVAAKIQVTDDDLKAGYETHKEQFHVPERRTIIQVSFPSEDSAKAAKARLDKGEDILKLASELKQTEKDITLIDKSRSDFADFVDQAIPDAAFALKEGEISQPVVGKLNTVLLKVTKITAEKTKPQNEVTEELRKLVQLDKALEEIQPVYDEVENQRAGSVKFEDIATKLGIPLTVVPSISADGRDKAGKDISLPARDDVLKAIFASDVGVENDAITYNDGYVWYDVREVVPSALRPLAEVKDQVKSDWAATKLRSLAADKAKAILAKAGTTTALETIASELGKPIQQVSGVRRTQTMENFDGVATLALFSAKEKTLTWALEADGQSARIIEVTKVSTPAFDAQSKDAKDMTAQMEKGLSSDLGESFIKALRADAKVTINEKLWADIRGAAEQPQSP